MRWAVSEIGLPVSRARGGTEHMVPVDLASPRPLRHVFSQLRALSPEQRVEARLERLAPPLFGRLSKAVGAEGAAQCAGSSRTAGGAFPRDSAAVNAIPADGAASVGGVGGVETATADAQRPPTTAEVEAARAVVADGRSERGRICTVCNMQLQDQTQAVAHCAGWKHRRRRSHLAMNHANEIGNTSAFDAAAAPFLDAVLVVGDCHGGRALALATGCVRTQFCGGTIFSWAVAKQRQLPNFTRLLRPPARRDGNTAANSQQHKLSFCVFSFGELDVRCHSDKWLGLDGGTTGAARLASAYVEAAQRLVASVDDRCVAVLLAVPPPSSEGANNPKAPFRGDLHDRATATKALNDALQSACEESDGVLFTGADTFAFARTASGTLRLDCSDGHVHVNAGLCAPVHRCLRRLIAERCGFMWAPEP